MILAAMMLAGPTAWRVGENTVASLVSLLLRLDTAISPHFLNSQAYESRRGDTCKQTSNYIAIELAESRAESEAKIIYPFNMKSDIDNGDIDE